MRIWLNRYQALSLYGPEYTRHDENGAPIVYFDSTINQKDSAELDYIIDYAAQHGIAVMPCVFSFGDFSEPPIVKHSAEDSSVWHNNPFHSILSNPYGFFDDTETNVQKVTRNLIRYIVSRWGYATNIMCWELWNEVSNMFPMCDGDTGVLQQKVLAWHKEMAGYVKKSDPYKRCITTSMGNIKKTHNTSPTNYNYQLYLDLFDTLDFVQQHSYHNIQKAKSKEQVSKILFDSITRSHSVNHQIKPFFMGEFGFGQSHPPYYAEKDPCGIDLHNSLWSSLFSAAIGPASLWWWSYLHNSCLFHNRYAPLLTFCQSLPILSETFTAHQTGDIVGNKLVFPSNIQTYYMMNAAEDTIYGWCQDTAFAYQSLRWLTDSVQLYDSLPYYLHFLDSIVFDPDGYVYTLNIAKRPGPSHNTNKITIPIQNQSVHISYRVTWYSTETGLPVPSLSSTASVVADDHGNRAVSFLFPSAIRNLANHTINNTFGDMAFSLILIKNGNVNKNEQPTFE